MLRKSKGDVYVWGLLGVTVVFAIIAVVMTWKRPVDDLALVVNGKQPELQTLVIWNNEMIRAHGLGDMDTAVRIAQRILAYPAWREFIPANAVMGSAMARKGDYGTAVEFFATALTGKGIAAPQPVVMNDYADALCHLGRYDEAEVFARRAVEESGGKVARFKQTLAQILRHAGKKSSQENLNLKQEG